jgi:uroporphyrin-III C-methyltransferase
MGKVIFLVAGPGDRELVTVKGKAVMPANALLYDALLSTELLEDCNHDCKLIYVGKRRSNKEFSQEEINNLLVFFAKSYGGVIRLEGGDPNLFWPQNEEAIFVEARGFETETIPGVSRANAAGIALTKRGVPESFRLISGTFSNGSLSGDTRLAAHSTATIVALMGVANLEEIANLISILRSPAEPMALIPYATFKDENLFAHRTLHHRA